MTFKKAGVEHGSASLSRPPSVPGKYDKEATNSSSGASGSKTSSLLTFDRFKINNDSYISQFPGALPLESDVFAWHAARSIWHSATIIFARQHASESLTSDSTDLSQATTATNEPHTQAPTSKTQKLCGKVPFLNTTLLPPPSLTARRLSITLVPYTWKGKEADYDYYVHFNGEDRRHDIWEEPSLLRPKNYAFPSTEPFVDVPAGPDEIHKHMDADYLREHEENTKLKTIGSISIGEYIVGTWYFSPYPKEYQNLARLHICEFCLSFFKHEAELRLHSALCPLSHPPGNEIYRDPHRKLALFEVDGAVAKTYSENLCFLSKLFLDHKTLRHPVFLFLFYVLTEIHTGGHHLVGYFSKEKYSKNNLSCIMCLPQHQRKGYGQFLINMSYALSFREGRRGTPERPLSDLGRATYIKYWAQVALAFILNAQTDSISLEDIAQATSVEVADVALALETVGLLRFTQPGGTPFLFLPQEFDAALRKYSRPVFDNRTIEPQSTTVLNHLLGDVHNIIPSSLDDNGSPTIFGESDWYPRRTPWTCSDYTTAANNGNLDSAVTEKEQCPTEGSVSTALTSKKSSSLPYLLTTLPTPVLPALLEGTQRRSKRRRPSTSSGGNLDETGNPLHSGAPSQPGSCSSAEKSPTITFPTKETRQRKKTASIGTSLVQQSDIVVPSGVASRQRTTMQVSPKKLTNIPSTTPPPTGALGAVVNLAWLRWEPYDMHMGPYEYAATG